MTTGAIAIVLKQRTRVLRRKPLRTSVRAALLAVVIGPLVAVTSLAAHMRRFPVPMSNPETILVAGASYSNGPFQAGLTFGDVARIRSSSDVLAGAAAVQTLRFGGRTDLYDYRDRDYTIRLNGARVFPSFFGLIGVTAVRGRVFSDASYASGDERSVVVSHAFWRDKLHASDAAIGAPIELGGQTYTLIGVTPSDFHGLDGDPVDVWMPWVPTVVESKTGSVVCCTVVARQKTGVPVADAARRLSQDLSGHRILLRSLREHLSTTYRDAVRLLGLTVGLITLLAGVTVIHNQLTHGVGSAEELTILAACGAPRGIVWISLMCDEVLITLCAIPAAVLLALATVELFQSLAIGTLRADVAPFSLLWRATGAGLLASLLSSTLSSLALMPRIFTGRIAAAPQVIGRQQSAWHTASSLAVAAVLTTILVLASIVTINALKLNTLTVGFEPSSILVADTRLDYKVYKTDSDVWQFERAALEQLSAVPGVQAVALASAVPILAPGRTVVIRSDALGRFEFTEYRVDHRFFELLRIPIVRGRSFAAREPEPVAIVSQQCARRLGDGGALGRKLPLDAPATIVGVAGDVASRVANWDSCAIYVPVTQETTGVTRYLLKVAAPDGGIETRIRRAIATVAPGQPVDRISDLDARVRQELAPRQLLAAVVGGLTVVAWAVAFIWFYGVVSQALTARAREIGIRLALGGSARTIGTSLLSREARALGIGTAAGLALSVPASRVTQHLIYSLTPQDLTGAATTALVGVGAITVLCASAVSRAVRREPQRLLRS